MSRQKIKETVLVFGFIRFINLGLQINLCSLFLSFIRKPRILFQNILFHNFMGTWKTEFPVSEILSFQLNHLNGITTHLSMLLEEWVLNNWHGHPFRWDEVIWLGSRSNASRQRSCVFACARGSVWIGWSVAEQLRGDLLFESDSSGDSPTVTAKSVSFGYARSQFIASRWSQPRTDFPFKLNNRWPACSPADAAGEPVRTTSITRTFVVSKTVGEIVSQYLPSPTYQERSD